MFDSTIFLNNFFNVFLIRLICCNQWPPRPGFSHKLASPTSCSNYCTQWLTVLTSTHLPPYTTCTQRMSMGGIFSPVKNSIRARCLNRMSPQPSISTGTQPDSCRFKVIYDRGEYHVTVWSRFYPVFIDKKYGRGGKTFLPTLIPSMPHSL
jgi:hypothetical protein